MGNKKLLKKRIIMLQLLKSVPFKKRREIVDLLHDDCLNIICECCFNLLNNLDLSKKNKKMVKRKFKSVENKVRKLANPKVDNKHKRVLLKDKQIGDGVFSLLAGIVLPAIISAFS